MAKKKKKKAKKKKLNSNLEDIEESLESQIING